MRFTGNATSGLERAALAVAGAGICAHVLVGLLDGHRLVLHRVGHLTLFLIPMWVQAAVVSVWALVMAGRRAPFALVSLFVA